MVNAAIVKAKIWEVWMSKGPGKLAKGWSNWHIMNKSMDALSRFPNEHRQQPIRSRVTHLLSNDRPKNGGISVALDGDFELTSLFSSSFRNIYSRMNHRCQTLCDQKVESELLNGCDICLEQCKDNKIDRTVSALPLNLD
jgi:hypothetical protein